MTREQIGPFRYQSSHPCVAQKEMGKVLSEDFSSVVTMEKDVLTVELGTINVIVLRTINITVKEVLSILDYIKVD